MTMEGCIVTCCLLLPTGYHLDPEHVIPVGLVVQYSPPAHLVWLRHDRTGAGTSWTKYHQGKTSLHVHKNERKESLLSLSPFYIVHAHAPITWQENQLAGD